jgi:hypothetical protein
MSGLVFSGITPHGFSIIGKPHNPQYVPVEEDPDE